MNFRHAKICLLHVVRDSQDFISRTLFIATIFTIQGSSCILEKLTTAILLKYSKVMNSNAVIISLFLNQYYSWMPWFFFILHDGELILLSINFSYFLLITQFSNSGIIIWNSEWYVHVHVWICETFLFLCVCTCHFAWLNFDVTVCLMENIRTIKIQQCSKIGKNKNLVFLIFLNHSTGYCDSPRLLFTWYIYFFLSFLQNI